MRNVLFVLAVLAMAVVACGSEAPPTPRTVYVPVTVTPRPPEPVARSSTSGYSGEVGKHVRELTGLGWTIEDTSECYSGDCVALLDPDECSYLMLFFAPSTGAMRGLGYGIDFGDEGSCLMEGADLAERQTDILTLLGAWDAAYWIAEMAETNRLPNGPGEPELSGPCGQWLCRFTLNEDLFGILGVEY